MELLRTHQIDLGLMEDLPGETDYIQEPFAKDRTLIVAAPDHPLAGMEHVRFEDLKKEAFLLCDRAAMGEPEHESTCAGGGRWIWYFCAAIFSDRGIFRGWPSGGNKSGRYLS